MNKEVQIKIFSSITLLAAALLCTMLAILSILGDLGVLNGWIFTSCLVSNVSLTSKCLYSFECNNIQRPRDIPQCVDYITGKAEYTSFSCTHKEFLCSMTFYQCDGQLMFLSHLNDTLPIILDCSTDKYSSYIDNTRIGCRYNPGHYWPILLNIHIYGFWLSVGIFLGIIAIISCCCVIVVPFWDEGTMAK